MYISNTIYICVYYIYEARRLRAATAPLLDRGRRATATLPQVGKAGIVMLTACV